MEPTAEQFYGASAWARAADKGKLEKAYRFLMMALRVEGDAHKQDMALRAALRLEAEAFATA